LGRGRLSKESRSYEQAGKAQSNDAPGEESTSRGVSRARLDLLDAGVAIIGKRHPLSRFSKIISSLLG
jgi:hypothetical protein